ncbi:MD-2-related lipid-recognition protein-like [Culicoides brevitarsis]|uniref:MD-2-related lipid-recognition protein-like n=1 Tax=Culicoides brevitarsis TaxID=469753 RepID=UPI00307C8826
MKFFHVTLLIFTLIGSSFAEVAEFQECSDEDSKQCTIHELRMSPCSNPSRCVLKKGESVEFSFDFTPEFGLDAATNKAYANINGEYVDWIGGLEENACTAVQCPLTANSRSTYTRSIKLSKTTQAGKFHVKWKLFNENETKSCCFEVNVQVKK